MQDGGVVGGDIYELSGETYYMAAPITLDSETPL